MRPLTAYHIFFQIEREYIIQTTPGSDADASIHDNKSFLPDVPRRYRNIKLLPDWYAGPGKRQKRKHRKSHGKIGFLELSRVISKRWGILDSVDPETKRYVTQIATRELDGYKVEMQEWRDVTGGELPASVGASKQQRRAVPTRKSSRVPKPTKFISPSSSPSPPPVPEYTPSYVPSSSAMQYNIGTYIENPELVLSLDQDFTAASAASSQAVLSTMMNVDTSYVSGSSDDEEDVLDVVDYSICSLTNHGHYVPSPPTSSSFKNSCNGRLASADGDSFCDPLFELDDTSTADAAAPSCMEKEDKRCVSPVVSGNVEIFTDPLFELMSC